MRLGNRGLRLLGLLLVVYIAVAVAAISWPRLAMVRQDHSNLPAGELIGAPGLSQSFHSPYAGLYRIDVKLATYARENHGAVEFSLRESLEGPDLVRMEVELE